MSGYVRPCVNFFFGEPWNERKEGSWKKEETKKRKAILKDTEVEKSEETREKATAVCVLLAQDDYSLQVTQFWRALRKTVRNIIIKNTRKSYISRKTKATQTLVVSIRFSPMCCIPRNKPH